MSGVSRHISAWKACRDKQRHELNPWAVPHKKTAKDTLVFTSVGQSENSLKLPALRPVGPSESGAADAERVARSEESVASSKDPYQYDSDGQEYLEPGYSDFSVGGPPDDGSSTASDSDDSIHRIANHFRDYAKVAPDSYCLFSSHEVRETPSKNACGITPL